MLDTEKNEIIIRELDEDENDEAPTHDRYESLEDVDEGVGGGGRAQLDEEPLEMDFSLEDDDLGRLQHGSG